MAPTNVASLSPCVNSPAQELVLILPYERGDGPVEGHFREKPEPRPLSIPAPLVRSALCSSSHTGAAGPGEVHGVVNQPKSSAQRVSHVVKS